MTPIENIRRALARASERLEQLADAEIEKNKTLRRLMKEKRAAEYRAAEAEELIDLARGRINELEAEKAKAWQRS